MIVQKAPAPEGTGAADGSEKPPASVAGLSGSLVIWLPMRLDVCGADDAEGTALPLDENSAAGKAGVDTGRGPGRPRAIGMRLGGCIRCARVVAAGAAPTDRAGAGGQRCRRRRTLKGERLRIQSGLWHGAPRSAWAPRGAREGVGAVSVLAERTSLEASRSSREPFSMALSVVSIRACGVQGACEDWALGAARGCFCRYRPPPVPHPRTPTQRIAREAGGADLLPRQPATPPHRAGLLRRALFFLLGFLPRDLVPQFAVQDCDFP